jgi:ribosomal protein S18 acetylase RimI-like enzyme
MAAAARIYREQFPGRVAQRFGNACAAGEFYTDLFRLTRLTWPETFFVARAGDELAGYLILTAPGASFAKGLLREGFLLRAVCRAATGRYGLCFRAARQVVRSLGAGRGAFDHLPHVYVVAVDSRYRGQGIGSGLLAAARAWCGGRYAGMWLYVERENEGAIRLYKKIGFTIAQSDGLQHAMVWNFGDRPGDKIAGATLGADRSTM